MFGRALEKNDGDMIWSPPVVTHEDNSRQHMHGSHVRESSSLSCYTTDRQHTTRDEAYSSDNNNHRDALHDARLYDLHIRRKQLQQSNTFKGMMRWRFPIYGATMWKAERRMKARMQRRADPTAFVYTIHALCCTTNGRRRF